MSGQLKAIDGTLALPGLAFANDPNTGFRRSAADEMRWVGGGVDRMWFDADGAGSIPGALTVSGAFSAPNTPFPAGTAMLFTQTAAPTGWTKSTTHNDKALRVVSGAASSGGSAAFTTAFASRTPAGTIGGTAITIAQMPLHGHPYRTTVGGGTGNDGVGGFVSDAENARTNQSAFTGTPTDSQAQQIGGEGGGQTHDHSFTGTAMDFAVAYVDCIIATKD